MKCFLQEFEAFFLTDHACFLLGDHACLLLGFMSFTLNSKNIIYIKIYQKKKKKKNTHDTSKNYPIYKEISDNSRKEF